MHAMDEHFIETVRQMTPVATGGGVRQDIAPADLDLLPKLFQSQLISRHADLAAREMRGRGIGYYTIGSSGHESNAAVAHALRVTDPALLHYRSGAFYAERSRMAGRSDALQDILLGVVGAAAEPISGGRHKVFGRHELSIIPQTSTIASHLPRAVGVAFALPRAKKQGLTAAWPADSVVVCSFGDASLNHSTAMGAINAAIQIAYRGGALPLLFVCEDNGIGISVRTPTGWVEQAVGGRSGLEYRQVDGHDVLETLAAARSLTAWVRRYRRPAFLHVKTVRLMGHAGSDVESAYRSATDIAADLRLDPVINTARMIIDYGIMSPQTVVDHYLAVRDEANRVAAEVSSAAQLGSAEEIMRPLTATDPDAVAAAASKIAEPQARQSVFGRKLPEAEGGLTLAQSINRSLHDLLLIDPRSHVFGEDVAEKGGVYGVTRGLHKTFGPLRVFNTLLDEQNILGIGLGAGVSGLLPIPEIQYLAYVHNAADQIRGEGATQRFFSNGQYLNPMVVRIAGLAYQKGFGGHFHNDNSLAALRDIPGLVIAAPSNPRDAALMLRTCAATAIVDGKVAIFVEPIALYHTRGLHTDDDEKWLQPYPTPTEWETDHIPVGQINTYGDGTDLTIVTYANGLWMSLRVAESLANQGISARVVDLRWLAPLPIDQVLTQANATGHVLIVDETRQTGGIGESLLAQLILAGYRGAITCVASQDSIIPLGDAANLVLVSEEQIFSAAVKLISP